MPNVHSVYTRMELTGITVSQISIPCALLFSHDSCCLQDIEEEDEEDEDEEYDDEDEEEMSAVLEAALAEDVEVPTGNSDYDKVRGRYRNYAMGHLISNFKTKRRKTFIDYFKLITN